MIALIAAGLGVCAAEAFFSERTKIVRSESRRSGFFRGTEGETLPENGFFSVTFLLPRRLLGGLLLMGAGLGVVVLSGASGSTIDIVLSFGIAALLYLVVEELMVEAHEGSQSPLRCATFSLAF